MPDHATHVTLDPAGVLRTLVLQEPEHPDITLTLRGTAPRRCSTTGGSGQPPTTGSIDQWPATATSTRSCNPRKLPRNIPDSSVADRRITGRRETVPAGSDDVGGWRHTDSRMPSDKLPPVAVDRRGTNVDEAVAFYEDVYASQDIHIGKPTADGLTWRTAPSATTTSSRWAHPLSTRTDGAPSADTALTSSPGPPPRHRPRRRHAHAIANATERARNCTHRAGRSSSTLRQVPST